MPVGHRLRRAGLVLLVLVLMLPLPALVAQTGGARPGAAAMSSKGRRGTLGIKAG